MIDVLVFFAFITGAFTQVGVPPDIEVHFFIPPHSFQPVLVYTITFAPASSQ